MWQDALIAAEELGKAMREREILASRLRELQDLVKVSDEVVKRTRTEFFAKMKDADLWSSGNFGYEDRLAHFVKAITDPARPHKCG